MFVLAQTSLLAAKESLRNNKDEKDHKQSVAKEEAQASSTSMNTEKTNFAMVTTTTPNHAAEPRFKEPRHESFDFYQIIHEQRVLLDEKDAHIATLQEEVNRLNLFIETTEFASSSSKKKKKKRKSSRRAAQHRAIETEDDDLGSNAAPPRENTDAVVAKRDLTSPGVDYCRPTLLRAQSSREYTRSSGANKPKGEDKEQQQQHRHRSKSCRDLDRRRRSSRRGSSRRSSKSRSHSRRTKNDSLSSSMSQILQGPPLHDASSGSTPAILGSNEQSLHLSFSDLDTSERRRPIEQHSTTTASLEQFLLNPRLVELYASSVNSNASPTGVTDGMLNDESGRLTLDSAPKMGKKRSKSSGKKKKKRPSTAPYRCAPPRQVSDEQLKGGGAVVPVDQRPPGQHPEEACELDTPEETQHEENLPEEPPPTADTATSTPVLLDQQDDCELIGGFSSGGMHRSLSSILNANPRRPDDDSDEETQTSQPLMQKKRPVSPSLDLDLTPNSIKSPLRAFQQQHANDDEPGAHQALPSYLDASMLLPRQPDDEGTQTSELTPSSFKSSLLLNNRGQTASPGPSVTPPLVTDHLSIASAANIDEALATYQVADHEVVDPYDDVGIYTGSLSSRTHRPQGFGRMVYHEEEQERSYEGEWVDGRWFGHGKLINGNGDIYEGMFANDARHGEGSYYWASGRSYIGTFLNDKRHGHGSITFPDGSRYVGEFFHGAREGKGHCSFADGGHYDGEWRNNMFCGMGECVWPDGRLYKGDFLDNEAHGYGIEYNPNGTIRHDGLWDHDTPV